MKRLILAVLMGIALLPVSAKDEERTYGVVSGNICTTTTGTMRVDEITVAEDSIAALWCVFTPNNDVDDMATLIEDVSMFTVLVNKSDTLELVGMIPLDPETYEFTDNVIMGIPYWDEFKAGKEYPLVMVFNGNIKLNPGDEVLSILKEVDFLTEDDEEADAAEEVILESTYMALPNLVIDNPLHPKKSTWRVGRTTSRVKLRNEPSLSGTYDKIVDIGDAVIYDRDAAENGFYKVTLVGTGEEGYIKREYVKDEMTIDKPAQGNLKTLRQTDLNSDPEVSFINKCDRPIIVTVSGTSYYLRANEEKTVTVKHGKIVIQAEALGVRSYYSIEEVSKGWEYSWTFIITQD